MVDLFKKVSKKTDIQKSINKSIIEDYTEKMDNYSKELSNVDNPISKIRYYQILNETIDIMKLKYHLPKKEQEKLEGLLKKIAHSSYNIT